jgi:putrescine transport system permease protein
MNIGIKNNTNIKVEKRVSIIDRTLRRLQENWRSIVIIIPFVWLLMFFLFPFFIVAKISLAEMKIASPPFTEYGRVG